MLSQILQTLILFTALLLTSPSHAKVAPAKPFNALPLGDFKISAPATWRPIEKQTGGQPANEIFRNTQSPHNESISVDAFASFADPTGTKSCDLPVAREVAHLRAQLFARLGFRRYSILRTETHLLKNSKFQTMTTIHSSYFDLADREVHVLERQVCSPGKMFVVTYKVDSGALGDEDRIARLLDFFQPVYPSRTPASMSEEVVGVVSGSLERGKVADEAPVAPLAKDLDLKDPKNAERCADVPEEKRRSASDSTFMGHVEMTLKTPGNCFFGLFDNVWGMVSGVGSLLWSGVKFANPFSSTYRDQVRATTGTIVSEYLKDKEGFVKRVGSEIYNVAVHEAGDFFSCLKTEEQVRVVCNMALNFLPNELLVKILSKVPLAAEETAKIAALTAKALGKDALAAKVPPTITVAGKTVPTTTALATATTAVQTADQAASPAAAAVKAAPKAVSETKAVEPAAKTPLAAAAAPAKGIDSIPTAAKYPLPAHFKEALAQNDSIKQLQSTYGTGKNLNFRVLPDVDEFEKTGAMREGTFAQKGEQMQAIFTRKVLHDLFPDAKISGSGTDPAIVLEVTDSVEQGKKASLGTPMLKQLQMADLKMANPGVGEIDRQSVRAALGIPATSKVVSLNNSVYNRGDQIVNLVEAIGRSHPDIEIVNVAVSEARLSSIEAELIAKNPGYRVMRVSKLDGRPLPQADHVILLNDTSGKMHSIYAASDVNVAAGAINLAEPLLAKTPTVFFDENSSYMHDYDSGTFKKMADQAKKTGGAESINSLGQLEDKLTPYLNGNKHPEIQPPYQVSTKPSEQTPLERFATSLKDQVTLQAPQTGGMKDVLASPAARHDLFSSLSRHVDELTRTETISGPPQMSAAMAPTVKEANDKILQLSFPTKGAAGATGDDAELASKVETLRHTLLHNVTERGPEWKGSAKALIYLEQTAYPAFEGAKTTSGISAETEAALIPILKSKESLGNYKAYFQKALSGGAPVP